MREIYFLLILTIFSDSKVDRKRRPPGEFGAAKDGAKYYEVKVIGGSNKIDGCYEKIDFHNVRAGDPSRKFPIYEQTGAEGSFLLKMSEKKKALWIFGNITFNNLYE